jgi:hypothetical protein
VEGIGDAAGIGETAAGGKGRSGKADPKYNGLFTSGSSVHHH